MGRLYRLFEASPQAAFAELEHDLAQLQARLSALCEHATALRETFDGALKTLTTQTVSTPAPTRWTYDVRLPNPYFDNVFEPEFRDEGVKRWVRRSGSIGARVALPRNVQYDFSIAVVDFVVPQCRPTFRLAVDGKTYPWLSDDGNVFSTVILENPVADGLDFQLSVDTAALPQDRDVSFSFSLIDIVRHEAAAAG